MLKDPHDPFGKLTKRYGDIFTFYQPAGRVVVLNNATLIREAKVERKDDMAGRSPEFMYPFGEIFGFNEITISDYSPKYIFRRKVFKSAMHVFGSGVDKSVDRARRAVDIAIEEIDLKNGQPFCPKKLLDSAMLVQLWEWLSSRNEPIEGTTITSLRELNDILLDIAYQSPLYHLFPFLRFFPTQFRRNIKRSRDIVHAVFEIEFEEHQKTYTPGVVRDLTDSFISAYKNELAKENGKDIGSIDDIASLMAEVALGDLGRCSVYRF